MAGTTAKHSKKKKILIALAIFSAGLLVLATPVLLRQPKSDLNWQDEFAYATTASTSPSGVITLDHVRDFSYRSGTTSAENWISNASINPDDIVRVWFVLEPFSQWKAIAHTYLTFETKDGSGYSFSVEARKEKGEEYALVKGLLREYEMTYVWATERDMITRQLDVYGHAIRMYPLALTPAQAKTLFVSLTEQSNELAAHPRFYNTLTANCTNMLAKLTNDIVPGMIPYDLSWNFPGSSDSFLARIGLIKTDKPFEDAKNEYELIPHKDEILKASSESHAQFGNTLRSFLPTPHDN